MPTMIGSNEIGGAFVRRSFTVGGERLAVNTRLSAEQVNAWPNRRALISRGYLAVFPPDNAAARGDRHIVHNGGGRFDVIVGHKLNDSPLTREQAEELAASGGN